MRLPPILTSAIALLGIAALPLAAQTTPTERTAAGQVLRQIDSLQSRLKPGDLGLRLATRKDADRDRILARAKALWDGGMESLSDHIGRNPEVGWKEFKTVDTLLKVIRGRGFTVDTGVAGLATAFAA